MVLTALTILISGLPEITNIMPEIAPIIRLACNSMSTGSFSFTTVFCNYCNLLQMLFQQF